MNKIYLIIALVFTIGLGLGFSINVSAEESLIPSWIKNTAGFWVDGQIGDQEFVKALQYLVEKDILKIPSKENSINNQMDNDVRIPLSNADVIKSLNTNPKTFSATSCKDGPFASTLKTSVAGKFTNGNFPLEDLDITVGLMDNNGNVIETILIVLYDLSPNETRLFDGDAYNQAGLMKSCEMQVTYVSQP